MKSIVTAALMVAAFLATGDMAHASFAVPDTATTSLLFLGSGVVLGVLRKFIR